MFYVSTNLYSENYGYIKRITPFRTFGDSLLFYEQTIPNGDEFSRIDFGNNYGRLAFSIVYGYNFGTHIDELNASITNNDTLGNICNYPIDLQVTNIDNSTLTFSPNPANSFITSNRELEHIQIFSSLGKLILDITNPTNNIDISQLSNGLVFIIAKGRNEENYSSKLLIEK